MSSRDDRQRVLEATDLVRLIGEQVALRPKGKEFVGLCPFHDDKSPSMFVSPSKQIYKCFSCGAGGSCFDFVMNYHKMSFPEALKMLAERAGVELTPWQGSGNRDQGSGPSERELIREANELALGFFRMLLKHPEHGRIAREYVDKRGISPEMVADFQLGVAPDQWEGLAKTIQAKGWNPRGFELAGLIGPSKQGHGYYDRLRHRLIFPIFDSIGRPIAFGGRVLPDSTRDDHSDAKYLNSPETKLFNKSATLYGIHLAKKPIIDSRTAVIVEGYTDVIACHQAGIRNVVATLGTSLTREHVTELRRYAEKVVVIFDADEAGQKAADRAVEVFLTGELDVSVANLPGGLDPADLLAEEDGVQRWGAAMEAAQDALAYQLARFQEKLDTAQTVTGRQRAAEAFIARLAELGLARTAAIRRAFVVKRLSGMLGLGEGAIHELIRQHAPRARVQESGVGSQDSGDRGQGMASPMTADPSPQPSGLDPAEDGAMVNIKAIELAERQVIGALVHDNRLFHAVLDDGSSFDEVLVPQDMKVDVHRRLFKLIHDRLADGQGVSLASLLGDLAANEEQYLSRTLTQAEADVEDGSLGNSDKLCEMFRLAVERLRTGLADREYGRAREEMRERLATAQNDVNVSAAALNEARDRLAARPSPGRILRRH